MARELNFTLEGVQGDLYNPQNHPNEFLKRNGLIFVGMLKRSGSILDKIQWH